MPINKNKAYLFVVLALLITNILTGFKLYQETTIPEFTEEEILKMNLIGVFTKEQQKARELNRQKERNFLKTPNELLLRRF